MTMRDMSKLTGNSIRGKTVAKGSRSLVTWGWIGSGALTAKAHEWVEAKGEDVVHLHCGNAYATRFIFQNSLSGFT